MYFRYDDALYLSDRVILYKDIVVVPVSLQSRVLNKLHSMYQGVISMYKHLMYKGVISMYNRAQQVVS